MKSDTENERLIQSLQTSWRKEKSGAATYRSLAARESDEKQKAVLHKLADAEEQHAVRWEARLRELGGTLPAGADSILDKVKRWLLVRSGTENAVKRLEEQEDRDTERYEAEAIIAGSPQDSEAMKEIRLEEKVHSKVLHSMSGDEPPQAKLEAIFKKEKWHAGHSGGWIGQAVYGANDGLGAVFGIVTGMAGYSGGGYVVWVAGVAGTLASALSMGSGAYLARKSEREVYEAELERERKEIELNPEEERQELELFYQLKGFTPEESAMMAHRLTQNPEQFLKTLAHEELGLSSSSFPNPVKEAFTASAATAAGGIIPVLPFIFASGTLAIVLSLVISTLAHFTVGVLKTIVTGRSWWRSGLEMTFVGLLTAAIAYGVGVLLSPTGHPIP
ncbi:MAG TPA: VIT1/CCC1 transporter family protein [Bacteroidota bacterium]|nr:VIT1/CCC1 transporter family protein [Bacteroidota bacterium]